MPLVVDMKPGAELRLNGKGKIVNIGKHRIKIAVCKNLRADVPGRKKDRDDEPHIAAIDDNS